MPNSYECIEKTQCSNKIIKYKERECAEQCSKIHKAFIEYNTETKLYYKYKWKSFTNL